MTVCAVKNMHAMTGDGSAVKTPEHDHLIGLANTDWLPLIATNSNQLPRSLSR